MNKLIQGGVETAVAFGLLVGCGGDGDGSTLELGVKCTGGYEANLRAGDWVDDDPATHDYELVAECLDPAGIDFLTVMPEVTDLSQSDAGEEVGTRYRVDYEPVEGADAAEMDMRYHNAAIRVVITLSGVAEKPEVTEVRTS